MAETTRLRQAHARPGRHRARRRRAVRWVPRLVLVVVCLVAASLTLLPWALGYQRYVITGGSMTGTIDRGSLIYDKVVPVGELRVGDIITYRPPAGSTPSGGLVTHRIVSIEKGDDGKPVFRTKGDANPTIDPWRFHLDDAKQAKVANHVPYVGYLFGLLGIAWLRMTLVGILAGLVVLRLWWALWRDAGTEQRERRQRRVRRTATAAQTDDLDAERSSSAEPHSAEPHSAEPHSAEPHSAEPLSSQQVTATAASAALAANAARAASGTAFPAFPAFPDADNTKGAGERDVVTAAEAS